MAKPDVKRAIMALTIERECVASECDRNCGACDLAVDRDWLLEAYNDALELLEEKLPRVMTPEELEQAEIGTVVWCEQRTAERCYLAPMLKDEEGLYDARHLSADPRAARLPGVRFWTSRPTDEQREATPWTA